MELTKNQHRILRLPRPIEVFIPMKVIEKSVMSNITGEMCSPVVGDEGVQLFISWQSVMEILREEMKLKEYEHISTFTVANGGMTVLIKYSKANWICKQNAKSFS